MNDDDGTWQRLAAQVFAEKHVGSTNGGEHEQQQRDHCQ